jgi:hypothetical protein
LSQQDCSGGAEMQAKTRDGSGRFSAKLQLHPGSLGETTKTNNEVSISILKCLKLIIIHVHSTKKMLQTK